MERTTLRVACLTAVITASGCYLSHTGDAEIPEHDGATDADGGVGDGGGDADTDAGFDARFDAEPDVEPPLTEPPPPGRCRTEPPLVPFEDPVLEYRWPNSAVVHRDSIHVCATPLVIDVDPTDSERVEPQIVFLSYPPLTRDVVGGHLRIVDPRTDVTITYPPDEGDRGVFEGTGNVAAGDIDGDGFNEIVGVGIRSGTYAINHDGTLLWESPYPTARDRGLYPSISIGGGPSLADLEGDGSVEVVVGHNVLDGLTGELRWVGPDGTGRGINQFLGPLGCVADLDGDGVQEVISGFTAFRANGDIYWDNPAVFDGQCAVADADPTLPGPEVILVSRGNVRMLNGRTGEQVWRRTLEGRTAMAIGGSPTVADFDGDGDVEFGVANGAAFGVYDPSCLSGSTPGCLDQGLLWNDTDTSDGSSSGTGASVFDFNGDGAAEVVYNDEYFFRVYDGATGRALFRHRNSSRTRSENPTIADVDDDGDAEIIFSANAEARFLRTEYWTDPGVEVWGDRRGRWVGARRIWNQHSYHITNVEEDGTIASPETDSWTVLNAYRQNLREDGDVLATPDLWGGRGLWECSGRGQATLTVNVQNWGLEVVGAGAMVKLYRGHPNRGGTFVAEARTTRTLEAEGGSEAISFEVMVSSEPQNWYAILDPPDDEGSGVVEECREDNNEVLFWQVGC
jgi:hypothetical protein